MGEKPVDGDALIVQCRHADAQRREHGIDLRAHEVTEGETALRCTHEKRSPVVDAGDRLS